jgi:hypothetical protein
MSLSLFPSGLDAWTISMNIGDALTISNSMLKYARGSIAFGGVPG